MQNKNKEQIVTNNINRCHRKNNNGTEIKALKPILSNNNDRTKFGTYNTYQQVDNAITEYSYNNNLNSTRQKKITQEENISNNAQNLIKNRMNHKINNDAVRMNTITYYSGTVGVGEDIGKGRNTSTIKISQNVENNFIANSKIKNYEKKCGNNKNNKSANRLELNNKRKTNDSLVFINSNKNTSIRYINNTIENKESKGNIIINNKRKNNITAEFNSNTYIYEKEMNESVCNYNNNSSKMRKNNNKLIKMSNFEISYESDKGEKNTYNSCKKKRNNIINNYIQNKDNGCIFYGNINFDEIKNNNNDYNEINNKAINNNRSNINNLRNNQYQYKIVHHNTNINNNKINKINNMRRRRIDGNDSLEMKDLHNNKSVSMVSNNKNSNMKSSSNINSPQLKSYKSNTLNNNINKTINSNYYKNNYNNVIEIIDPNSSNSNNFIYKNNVYTNVNIESPIIISSQNINCRKSINTFNTSSYNNSNYNFSEKRKKKEGINARKIKYGSYHRKSDIKKIIFIQSIFRGYILRLNLSNDIQIYVYFREFFELIYNILYIRKINYWKYFIQKMISGSNKKLINKNKTKKKNSSKNKLLKVSKENQNNSISNTKSIIKNNEMIILHKELGDSFNIINDNNNLKIKLDEMIKENNELKNQIFDNKNIEERLKQLLIENKKNQNINSIIMKDNQQLAKKLKNIQENRNNQLVIQNQSSVNMGNENNILFQTVTKLKHLFIKILVFKKILKIRNFLKIYFNKYRGNVKKIKNYKIEKNNIFIDNKKKINIQMANNFNINFISQNDNYKHYLLHKLFTKKEKEVIKYFSKHFYKLLYIVKCTKIQEQTELEKKSEEEELIKKKNEQKKYVLQSIVDKYERNFEYKLRKIFKEWKLRGIIFKMKGIAKEIKKKKKLKRKIRDKLAKETLNNLKNKTANLQSAHELSYKIDKSNKKEDETKENTVKNEENKKKDDDVSTNKEEEKNNNIDEEDSEESFGLDD